ncbi:MAG TPA: S8 family serine peptidase [Planctomycetota bacterium]|nr:S8 family serine peptidase [Planctomycetota bacterium]
MHSSLAPRALVALSFTTLIANLASAQSVQELTGFNRLAARLGPGNYPTGAGMLVAQVEAPAGGAYAPDANNPEFVGKTITQKSGLSNGPSGHATLVGQHWFGTLTSIAPGISLIDAYEANHWLGTGFLNGSGSTRPQMVAAKIFSHSWIGNAGGANNGYLRKLDAVIESQGLIVCAGVNNGAGPLDVALLSHAFNAISVGRSDGLHHAGHTALGVDGPGRMKPELVAPAPATSFSTPLVSGAAALLVETAWTDPHTAGNPHAALPEVIKAVLMAGAQHRPGWSNAAVTSGNMRGTTSTPLDPIFGADQLDVDTSHWILSAGEQAAASTAQLATSVNSAGWVELDIGSGQSRWLRFQIEANKPFVSVIAAWDRSVAPNYATWSVADLVLELWTVDAQGAPVELVGTPAGSFFSGGNVQSDSAFDNVEHLYLNDLAPGEYLLELRRTQDGLANTRAALAWNFACAIPVPYGSAKTNSQGQQPQLRSTGVPSLFGADFELTVTNGIPGKIGIALESSSRANIPFGGGTLLLQPPLHRYPPVQFDANGAVSIAVPITPAMVGTTRDFQFWFRDPQHPDGTGIGLTDALEVQFCH